MKKSKKLALESLVHFIQQTQAVCISYRKEVIIVAVIETCNIDGATVHVHDNYIQSREESEKIMERVSDIILRQLNAQHNGKRMNKLEKRAQKKDHL